MGYCDGCPSAGMVMHPVSGSHELPVFEFLAGPVANESMSFGRVKALFRKPNQLRGASPGRKLPGLSSMRGVYWTRKSRHEKGRSENRPWHP